MRKNLPVTNIEYVMEDGRPIVSKTDLKGKITYINPYFVEVSGFTEEELIGAPHNLVRHPDMPPEAFADLWSTLKAGEMWSAMVKNRRKNGDFYWVIANVTPAMENGQIVGYMSVRTKPTRDQVRQAEDLYRRMREGQASDVVLHRGHIMKKGLRGLAARLGQASLGRHAGLVSMMQLVLLLAAVSPVLAAGSGAAASYQVWSIVAATFCAASVFYQWYFLHNQVAQPLDEAIAVAKAIAGGDLTKTVSSHRHDDLGRLLRGLQQTTVNLTALIGDVRTNSTTINKATKEIAAGNMNLSARTEMQASSLEETASSMEEFASTVKQNADNAQAADQLVRSATQIASKGGDMVGNVGSTMEGIIESSGKVKEIVSIIDSIAFQTNILALNAAVEAARAGEHGRGFAVVATEVRTLAHRSATAAKEIGSLISDSIDRVEEGGQLVGKAQQTMQEIMSSVKQVSDIVSEIALASKEQATGIHQVNQAISQMDEVTQQNAALVEQAAAASASLNEQAAQLVTAASVFNMGGSTRNSAFSHLR